MKNERNLDTANVTLGWKERFSFATGDFAYNCVYAWVTSFLMIFYTDVFLIPAAAVSILMLVVRLYDAINDPILGSMMDRSNSRMGRYRPWIIIGGIGLCISGVLLFWAHPGWDMSVKMVYMYVTYIVVVTFSTIFYMAYMAMTGCISNKAEERAKCASWRMIASYGAMMAVGYAAPYMIAYFGSENAAAGYVKSVLICAVIAIPLFLLTSLGTKERVTTDVSKNRSKGSVKRQWQLLWKNKPMMILLLCMTVHGVQMNGRLGVATYFCNYVGNGVGVLATFNLLNSLACVAGCFLAPVLFQKTGNKGQTSSVILFICAASMFGQYFAEVPSVFFYVLVIITGICYGCFSSLMFSMIPDAVDLTDATDGLRLDGFFNAIASFGFKVGGALGTAAIGWVLAAAGYVENTTQTAECLRAIRALMCFLPGGFCLLAGLFLLGYRINRAKHAEILAKCRERNAK